MINYFPDYEQQCKCCGKGGLEEVFLGKLIQARRNANIPFVLNSAFRCKKHNTKIKGAKYSRHLKGIAADIKCRSSIKRFIIIDSLIKSGMSRIIIYPTFIHVDNSETKHRKVIWSK